jgi:hypothetical protein
MNQQWQIDGWRNNRGWITLFAPFKDRADAVAMASELQDRNPACVYRVVACAAQNGGER